MNRARRYGLKTVTTGRRTVRPRALALVAGTLAALAMIVVGCTGVTTGVATYDKADAPEYRASVSSSSAARESERQVAVRRSAVHTSCDAFGSSSGDSVAAVNDYVDAYNNDAPDAPGKSTPAIDALNKSADAVSGSLSDLLPADLTNALNGWVDAARQLAGAIAQTSGPDDFNTAIRRLNDTKTTAGTACEAAY